MRHRRGSHHGACSTPSRPTETALLLIGWDWADTSHAVTILDTAGAGVIVTAWTLSHTQETSTRPWLGWPATTIPRTCQWRSKAATAWWSTGCWPPATRHPDRPRRIPRRPATLGCLASQARSRRQLQAGRLPAHRWSPAAPAGADGYLTRKLQALVRLRDDHVAARPPPVTRSARCWTATGPPPSSCSFGLPPRSPWPSWPSTHPAGRRRARPAPTGGILPPTRYRGGRSPAQLFQRLRAAPRHGGLDPAVLAQLVGPRCSCSPRCWPASPTWTRRWASGSQSTPRPGCWPACHAWGQVSLGQLLAGLILDRAPSAERATAQAGAAPVTIAFGTPKPSGSWAMPGCASSGPAGTPTPPTTRPSTPPNNALQAENLTQETQALPRMGARLSAQVRSTQTHSRTVAERREDAGGEFPQAQMLDRRAPAGRRHRGLRQDRCLPH
jgi:hypothetical protein